MGNSLKCLQPLLDEAEPHDRWLVITDGAIPDLSAVDGKIAVICIATSRLSDPRCIEWSQEIENNPIALERACRKLQQLLR